MASLTELQQALAQALLDANDQSNSQLSGQESLGDRDRVEGKFIAVTDERLMADGPLAGISIDQLRRSRTTLLRKRISQTRRLMPHTVRVLGERYRASFGEFAASHHFRGFEAPLFDALYFGQWLCQRQELPVWVGDLARWESLRFVRQALVVLPLRYRVWHACRNLSFSNPPDRRRSLWIALRFRNYTTIHQLF